jgi:hypothetical protein
MTTPLTTPHLPRWPIALAGLFFTLPALANDFPTVDRVLYVQECMSGRTGSTFELVNKCSCALDALAGQISYDEYVQLSTATKATSIGGERGGYIRDAEILQKQIRRYRELQSQAKSGCFLGPDPR